MPDYPEVSGALAAYQREEGDIQKVSPTSLSYNDAYQRSGKKAEVVHFIAFKKERMRSRCVIVILD